MDLEQKLEALRLHVDERLEAQDGKLDEVLSILKASKMLVGAIKWAAGIAAAIITAWAAYKGVK